MGTVPYNSLYRLLDLEKSTSELHDEIIKILPGIFKNTLWNIGAVIESTAQLKFARTDYPFNNLNNRAKEAFEKRNEFYDKKNIPKGYKWVFIAPMIYKKQNLGVFLCLGKGKKDKSLDSLAEELGFILQQSQLKKKLIKDTMLMNAIIVSAQNTASSTEIEPLIRILFSQLKKYFLADGIRLYMWEEEGTCYYDETGLKKKIVIPEEKSVVSNVKASGRSLMLKRAYEYADFNPEVDAISEKGKTLNLIAMPVKIASSVKGVLLAVNSNPDKVFVGSELIWAKSVCIEIGAALEKIKLYQDIRKLFLSSIEALTAAIEGKDPYTHGHSRRVTMFSMIIGKELGLDKETIEDIRLSGLLHDIGKIAVPESILLKPGKLTDDEWYNMKQHPVKGVNMLEHVNEFVPLLPGIKHHHEHYNGKGYPEGLKGQNIPLIARIIAVADAFDAMTSKRIYRGALSEDEALKEIEKCKGTQFDPEIADVFINIYREKFFPG